MSCVERPELMMELVLADGVVALRVKIICFNLLICVLHNVVQTPFFYNVLFGSIRL